MLNDDNWHAAPVLIFGLMNRFVALFRSDEFVVYPELATADEASDVLYRASFYLPNHRIYYAAPEAFALKRPEYFAENFALSANITRVSLASLIKKIITVKNVLVTSPRGPGQLMRMFHRLSNINYVDRLRYRGEAAAYYHAYNYSNHGTPPSAYLDVESLPKREFAFVFGSGPSLDTAYQYDFGRVSAYKIICNSLVKNKRLLDHIRPDFVVCADAALHFGPSVYASTFRSDLVSYLKDTPACKLLIPETYNPYFREHVYSGANVYTIPCLTEKSFNVDLRALYAVHDHGSILNRLQLPLASTLSDRVLLLGYDGRSKKDQSVDMKYWAAHSTDSNYTELIGTLFEAHPYLPAIDKDAYAAQVAEKTEKIISLGEQAGKEYLCINESSIPALQSRQAPAALRQMLTPGVLTGR